MLEKSVWDLPDVEAHLEIIRWRSPISWGIWQRVDRWWTSDGVGEVHPLGESGGSRRSLNGIVEG